MRGIIALSGRVFAFFFAAEICHNSPMLETILLAKPRGFCAGVERAVEIVERLLKQFGPPIFVKHEIVHNRFVVDDFKKRGVVFLENPADAPEGAVMVFSAHGVSRAVREAAQKRRQKIFDATCPLVTKVHAEILRHRQNNREVVMIGHRGHPEVEGALGQADGGVLLVENENDIRNLQIADPGRVAFVTQTTLSVDDTARLVNLLREKFPAVAAPKREDICYATQNRQDAVKRLAEASDLVLVVGSPESSNSNRLREVALARGAPARLIDRAQNAKAEWLRNARTVGVTAGASAPEPLVDEVVRWLRKQSPAAAVREMDGIEETVVFAVPRALANHAG